MKSKRIVCVLMVFILTVGMWGCKGKNEKENVTASAPTISSTEKYEINLYYYDNADWAYFNAALESFNKDYPNITVNLKYTDASNYIEKLVNNNNDNVADVYVLQSKDIEKAYLAGIARVNSEGIYSEKGVFPQRALDDSTYKDKLLGYPLYFNTQVMLYNNTFGLGIPTTFDELKEMSNNIEVSEGKVLENILTWDLDDMRLNYLFMGGSADIAGKYGDDKNKFSISSQAVNDNLTYFKELTRFYNITRTNVTADTVTASFATGRTIFALVNSDDIKNISSSISANQETAFEYKIEKVPDISKGNKTAALSDTTVLMVNPYSKNTAVASLVAKYMSYDAAELIYEHIGSFSARKMKDVHGVDCSAVYDMYEASDVRIKLMDVGDFYVKLDIAFHNICDDGDIAAITASLQDYITKQFK